LRGLGKIGKSLVVIWAGAMELKLSIERVQDEVGSLKKVFSKG